MTSPVPCSPRPVRTRDATVRFLYTINEPGPNGPVNNVKGAVAPGYAFLSVRSDEVDAWVAVSRTA